MTGVDSHFGTYLAARQATREQDTTAAAAFYDRTLDKDPDNQIIRERAFLLELSGGNFDGAVDHALLVVKDRQRNRLARMALATEAIRNHDYAVSREHMSESAMGLYNALAVDLLTAWTYAGEGNLEEAKKSLGDLQAFGSGDLISAYHLALIHEHAGKTVEAETYFLNALEQSGRVNLRIVEAYGRFLQRQKRYEEATTLFSEFLAVAPNQIEITSAKENASLGRSVRPFVRSIDDGAAESFLSVAGFLNTERTADLSVIYLRLSLALREDLEVSKAILGDIFQRRQQWDRAAKAYASIPMKHPLGTEAAIQIANSQQRMKKSDEAIIILERLVKKKPNEIAARVSLADLYRSLERYDIAIENYTKSLEISESQGHEPIWFVYYARGISYHQLGNWSAAEKDLLMAMEISPDQPMILNYLGYSWIEREYRVHDALALVEKAVEYAPNNGFIVDSLGWAHYQLGNYEKAIKNLERAVELEPEDPTLHDHLGDAYWKAGRYLEAGFEWQHALKLEPDAETVVLIEKKLMTRSQIVPNS